MRLAVADEAMHTIYTLPVTMGIQKSRTRRGPVVQSRDGDEVDDRHEAGCMCAERS